MISCDEATLNEQSVYSSIDKNTHSVGQNNIAKGFEILSYLHGDSWNFPGGARGKEPACSGANTGSVPGLGRSSGGCLVNPMDRGAWRAAVVGLQSRTRLKRFSTVAQHSKW